MTREQHLWVSQHMRDTARAHERLELEAYRSGDENAADFHFTAAEAIGAALAVLDKHMENKE